MWDAIAAELLAHFKAELGVIAAAPLSFVMAVAFSALIIWLVLYRLMDGKHRQQQAAMTQQLAIMTATIDHQRELLAGHREREEKATETIAEITRKPEFRLLLMGGNVFTPDDAPTLAGFAVGARLWNTGAPSVAVSWSLTIIPKGQTPVLAQWTRRPSQIRAQGPVNSAVLRSSDALDLKTRDTPVGAVPEEGDVLFYATLHRDVVKHPDTWIELSVMDAFQNETTARQRMGDWLQR
jgi:hypothetical protein